MTSKFKAGTWVYVTDDTGQASDLPEKHRLTKGESRLVEDVSPHGYLRVHGSPAYWIPQRFAVEKPRETPKLDALMAPAPTPEKGDWVQVWMKYEGNLVGRNEAKFRGYLENGASGSLVMRLDSIVDTWPHGSGVPPWVKETPEPGGRYAIVRSGPLQHSRHNAAGGWLGTDGEWRTWEQVCEMATRANDPKVLMSDEEGTRA